MKQLNEIECFLLDMDGTIYLGGELIEGAKEFLALLKEQKRRIIFLTNNSSKNALDYEAKLKGLGIEASTDEIFTSGEATAKTLQVRHPGARVFLMGTPALESVFLEHGFALVTEREEMADLVVLGFDTTLTYDKIWQACDRIREGAIYYATHPDFNCPLADGKWMPDTGAMIKMIEGSTGMVPEVIGKPEKTMIEAVSAKFDVDLERIAMVGDRLYTDIRMGEVAGITSILVYSGETTPEDYKASEIEASFVFDSVKELAEALKEA